MAGGRPPERGTKASELVGVRLTPKERKAYDRAAAAEGLSISNWVRKVCGAAIKRRQRMK